jgi:hypothetical protein
MMHGMLHRRVELPFRTMVDFRALTTYRLSQESGPVVPETITENVLLAYMVCGLRTARRKDSVVFYGQID